MEGIIKNGSGGIIRCLGAGGFYENSPGGPIHLETLLEKQARIEAPFTKSASSNASTIGARNKDTPHPLM